MSLQKLPSGKWRSQVYDAALGKNVSVSKVLGPPGTFDTKREAKAAREKARARLQRPRAGVTVAEFRDRWITDSLFARPKRSTMLHNAERTKAFADKHGDLLLEQTDIWGDFVVAQWLAGGKNKGTVDALRAMFNDAMSAKAGRLTPLNPFAGLGLSKGPGNKLKQPPSELQMANMVAIAWEATPPSFAAYLEFACLTAMRPGELDALEPGDVDLAAGEIHVRQQWNAKTRDFDLPKYGAYTIALVADARQVLERLDAQREAGHDRWVFTTLRGTHYTPSSRTHHWNRVRAAAGLADMTLYLATRHYFGWYAVNVLGLDSAIVAEQLGHKDGGKLVEQLYGHPDKARRRRLIREAHDARAKVTPLRVVREEGA